MRYVKRDQDGNITGHFSSRRPGYAEEVLADDHPDMLAYAARTALPVSWTAREFMARFTDSELIAIVEAKATNPMLEIWWTKASAGPVERDHPDTAAGLDFLISLGLLTAERKAEIVG